MCLAHVYSADANSKAGWTGLFHQVLSYLMSEFLLDLKPQREMLHDAVILRQPDHSPGDRGKYTLYMHFHIWA